jgi:hypothetical protein
VDAAFAAVAAENGGATSPALAQLRAGWLQRPKRLVRSYRVLEQSEDGGVLRVRVTAELDEAYMRREFDRSRGAANRGVAPGVLPVLSVGAPEAGTVLVNALGDQGIRAQLQPGATSDEAALRALAARAGRSVALVNARTASEGPVRGTGQQAVECSLGVRLVSADGGAGPERNASARGFQIQESDARAACFARAAHDVLPALLPEVGGRAGPGADLRVVTLDLDINEPAVISPVLRALRKIGGPTSTEVRRVIVGRVEVRVSSRLTAAALVAGLGRELSTLATVTRAGSDQGPRVAAQIRLLPATLPPAAAAPAPGAPPATTP